MHENILICGALATHYLADAFMAVLSVGIYNFIVKYTGRTPKHLGKEVR